MQHRSPLHRAAFTLIELLVVIAIIAVLVGILVVGVIPMLSKGPDIRDVNDMSQLSIALQSFKNKYGVFPPSKIKLCNRRNQYGTTPLDNESIGWLNRIWNRLGKYDPMNPNDPNFTSPFMMTSGNGIEWAGAGVSVSETLDGDQCLVFFLGGPRGTDGFAPSQENPCKSSTDRIRLFEFNPARLVARNGTNFPSYLDNYGTGSNQSGLARWFMYFSSGRSSNGYQVSHAVSVTRKDSTSDSVQPILMDTTRFQNRDTFQIMTAGLDGEYGSLTQWNNGSGASTTTGWQDNRTNFSPNKLIAGSAN